MNLHVVYNMRFGQYHSAEKDTVPLEGSVPVSREGAGHFFVVSALINLNLPVVYNNIRFGQYLSPEKGMSL